MMGWCADGFHKDHPKQPCPGAYKPFWFEKRRVGRVLKEVIVEAPEERLCDCRCHGKIEPKRKPTRRRRKK